MVINEVLKKKRSFEIEAYYTRWVSDFDKSFLRPTLCSSLLFAKNCIKCQVNSLEEVPYKTNSELLQIILLWNTEEAIELEISW